ncbi:MAG: hypothetical protein HY711_06815 [Candidatus Melainabacteria bacterium]|nr:hypothetical protein [Candidatus Melainabacteria bacterium]
MRSFLFSAGTLFASLAVGVELGFLCYLGVPPVCSQEIVQSKGANALAKAVAVHPAEASLKSIRDVINRLRSAALAVINDVEQRDMAVVGEPMLIQPIAMKDDTHAIGWAQEMEDLGPALPPRKRWLDVDVSNVGELLQLLQSEVAAMVFPDDGQAQCKESLANVNSVVNDMLAHYQSLKELTKGPQYDNLAIGKQVLKIYDDAAAMEAPWKDLVKLIKNKS